MSLTTDSPFSSSHPHIICTIPRRRCESVFYDEAIQFFIHYSRITFNKPLTGSIVIISRTSLNSNINVLTLHTLLTVMHAIQKQSYKLMNSDGTRVQRIHIGKITDGCITRTIDIMAHGRRYDLDACALKYINTSRHMPCIGYQINFIQFMLLQKRFYKFTSCAVVKL